MNNIKKIIYGLIIALMFYSVATIVIKYAQVEFQLISTQKIEVLKCYEELIKDNYIIISKLQSVDISSFYHQTRLFIFKTHYSLTDDVAENVYKYWLLSDSQLVEIKFLMESEKSALKKTNLSDFTPEDRQKFRVTYLGFILYKIGSWLSLNCSFVFEGPPIKYSKYYKECSMPGEFRKIYFRPYTTKFFEMDDNRLTLVQAIKEPRRIKRALAYEAVQYLFDKKNPPKEEKIVPKFLGRVDKPWKRVVPNEVLVEKKQRSSFFTYVKTLMFSQADDVSDSDSESTVQQIPLEECEITDHAIEAIFSTDPEIINKAISLLQVFSGDVPSPEVFKELLAEDPQFINKIILFLEVFSNDNMVPEVINNTDFINKAISFLQVFSENNIEQEVVEESFSEDPDSLEKVSEFLKVFSADETEESSETIESFSEDLDSLEKVSEFSKVFSSNSKE